MQFPTPRETFAASDVLALRRSGLDVEVHSLRGDHPRAATLEREQRVEDVTRTSATAAGWVAGWRRPVTTLRVAAAAVRSAHRPGHAVRVLALAPRVSLLAERIRRTRPDVVHLYWGHYPSLLGLELLRAPKRPVVTIALGAYDLHADFAETARVVAAADAAFTHARVNVPDLEHLGARRIEVVPRGLDVQDLPDGDTPRVAGRVALVGHLQGDKAFDDAIDAAARVRAGGLGVHLVVAGEGPERARLERCARARRVPVRFVGRVPRRLVLELLAGSEALLVPSRKDSERLPNVAKEAMLVGCPVVVTDTPGIGELVADGHTGWIRPRGDPAGLAEALDRTLRDRTRSDAMARCAARFVRRHFDVNRSAERMAAVWTELTRELSRERS